MNKLLIVLILLVLFTQNIQAQVIEFHPALPSASKDSIAYQETVEVKRQAIKRILESHNSPMVNSVDTFIRVADENNLNPYLLPSITGTESTFGRFIKPGSYNPFGWGGGEIMFDSWDDAIETVGRGLRQNYVNKGAQTIPDVGRIYAASPTWPMKVKHFIGVFENAEQIGTTSAQKELNFAFNAVK